MLSVSEVYSDSDNKECGSFSYYQNENITKDLDSEYNTLERIDSSIKHSITKEFKQKNKKGEIF